MKSFICEFDELPINIKKLSDKLFSEEFPKILKHVLNEDVTFSENPTNKDVIKMANYVIKLREKGLMVIPEFSQTPIEGSSVEIEVQLKLVNIKTQEEILY